MQIFFFFLYHKEYNHVLVAVCCYPSLLSLDRHTSFSQKFVKNMYPRILNIPFSAISLTQEISFFFAGFFKPICKSFHERNSSPELFDAGRYLSPVFFIRTRDSSSDIVSREIFVLVLAKNIAASFIYHPRLLPIRGRDIS